MIVALDSEAFNALAGPASVRKQRVRRILRRSQMLDRRVVVPSLVLAELYRGRGHNQLVDAGLARESSSLDARDTDRTLARIVGGVLAGAGARSALIVDAHEPEPPPASSGVAGRTAWRCSAVSRSPLARSVTVVSKLPGPPRPGTAFGTPWSSDRPRRSRVAPPAGMTG